MTSPRKGFGRTRLWSWYPDAPQISRAAPEPLSAARNARSAFAHCGGSGDSDRIAAQTRITGKPWIQL